MKTGAKLVISVRLRKNVCNGCTEGCNGCTHFLLGGLKDATLQHENNRSCVKTHGTKTEKYEQDKKSKNQQREREQLRHEGADFGY